MTEFKYDVFLSYRHKPLDAAITQKVFNFLESYRMPDELSHAGFKGIRRVFRDTEELPVSRILTSTIDDALHATDCLIVVCSTDTPSSEWVDREVSTFIELGRADKIYPLLITGDASLSFPASLKLVPDIEDRIMDVRCPEADQKTIMASAEVELLKVIAAVSGCNRETLKRADQMERRNRIMRKGITCVIVFAFVCTVSGYLWNRAEIYRKQTAAERETSLAVLDKLTYGLPDKLVDVPGTYTKVATLLKDNANQIQRILEISAGDESSRMAIAANEEKLATALTTLGNYSDAEDSESKAISVYEDLINGNVSGADRALASAYNNLGRILKTAGRYEDAGSAYDKAISMLRKLNDTDTLSITLGNKGANDVLLGDYSSAIESLSESLEMMSPYENNFSHSQLISVASSRYNLGVAQMQSGNYSEAEEEYKKSIDLYEQLLNDQTARVYRLAYIRSLSGMATCLTYEAKFTEATTCFDKTIPMAEEIAADQDNMEAQTILADLYNNCGLCLNMDGNYTAAGTWYEKFASLEETISASSGTALSQANVARAYYNVAENAFKEGDYTLSRDRYDQCLKLYSEVCDQLGSYHRSEYLARLAYYQIIYLHDYAEAVESSREAVELQPDSAFACLNYGYALMYNGEEDQCEKVFTALAKLGKGQVTTVRLDFAALQAAGLSNEHMDSILTMMESIAQ